MKFTLNWLKQHLDTDASIEVVAEKLTDIGLEIEDVTDRAAALADIRVAYIEEAGQHPDADRLKLCRVNTGDKMIQVVCGAPNARTGLKVALAQPGAIIPIDGSKLKPGKIRGIESQGMMCSTRELCLGEDHDGIIELPADAEIGAPVASVLGADDPIIEIGLTPNRPDCTGVRGIARDLAAAGIGTLKADPRAQAVAGSFDSPIGVAISAEIAANNAVPAFYGRYIRGVKNGESPDWLKARLEAIGLRPISALVDITNLVTHDLGRPLHVFDADKLSGDINVRYATNGEKLAALDNKEYELSDAMVVIADQAKALGIGGIIGGDETGCLDETVNVFVECALFDPISIAKTGRKLQINSDARYRFERGVDPQSIAWGMEVATHLITEICGGEVSHVVKAGEVPNPRNAFDLRIDRILELGGVTVEADRAIEILTSLGFEVSGSAPVITAVAPTWRPDIIGEADLVEEVLRIVGYDKIPTVPLERETSLPVPALSPMQKRVGLTRRILASRGLYETVTWSFTDSRWAKLFGELKEGLFLANPISSDLDVMRPNALINMIAAAGRNQARGFSDLALFEVGPEFFGDQPGDQRLVAAGLRAGSTTPRSWTGLRREVDVFDVKADVEALVDALGTTAANLQVNTEGAPAWYHPGRSAALQLGPKNVLGYFGELHPKVLKALGVKGRVVAFELFVENIPMPKKKGTARPALNASSFQSVERDFAFLLDDDVKAEAIIKAARSADRALITDVTIFDLYAGKGIEDGKKSLAFSITLQPTKATLTEEEIDAVSKKVVEAVQKATGGSLRA
ncbi:MULTISPECIES: phenylalanine--tRNA ligase subunit beta [Thalassospira]|uniref:Phenylalanine--tRNA ligase beta subunit n=2 Tax=Thalassospira TaxID=168934 RepID=A0A367W0P1_9PROT|nr:MULTISPECIES: phenylalanine--tRNA ligase subunit beta [Thalassospira]MDG4721335.1 phenylalanine--tRNA ligase subunit beta [Thalassospira sp. FZY0004]RCK32929.1 phenylalanyl-tRNA synthetase subunit beta [Thalassospira profundimaris]